MLQIPSLFATFDALHQRHGDSSFSAIYGAGKTQNPRIMLVFMNPTARNISANTLWNGIRAPWLGTKHVWKMLFTLGLLSDNDLLNKTQIFRPDQWTSSFAEALYDHISQQSLYITNIAKCTQVDARPLPNTVFKEYLPAMFEEIEHVNPEVIVCFGNQVSSLLLGKNISVSQYTEISGESLQIGAKSYRVYPTYYPVGQGMRNMPKAIERIKHIINATM